MSRHRRALANAASIFAPAEAFNPRAEDWKKIEKAFGKPLRMQGRYHLAEIATHYMMRRAREFDPPLLASAIAQVDAIERAAVSLEAALREVESSPASVRLPGMFLAARSKAELSGGDPQCMEVTIPVLRLAARSFARAAPQVRSILENDATKENVNTAFIFLIRALRDFATVRDVKVSARVDDPDQTSPFVEFASELNEALPERYKQAAKSKLAFSKAVSVALKLP